MTKILVRLDRKPYLVRSFVQAGQRMLETKPLTGELLVQAEAGADPFLLVAAPSRDLAHAVASMAWDDENGWKGMDLAIEFDPHKFAEPSIGRAPLRMRGRKIDVAPEPGAAPREPARIRGRKRVG